MATFAVFSPGGVDASFAPAFCRVAALESSTTAFTFRRNFKIAFSDQGGRRAFA